MVLYESHLGGFYVGDKDYSYDELYCEECGDSDTKIGSFETYYELWELLQHTINIFVPWGYTIHAAYEVLFYPYLPEEEEEKSEIEILTNIYNFLEKHGDERYEERKYNGNDTF